MLTVTVYSTGPACMRCRLTEQALAKAGVGYAVVDITVNEAARTWIAGDLGYSEAPVVVVEDGTGQDHWSGFRPDNITRIAAANARLIGVTPCPRPSRSTARPRASHGSASSRSTRGRGGTGAGAHTSPEPGPGTISPTAACRTSRPVTRRTAGTARAER